MSPCCKYCPSLAHCTHKKKSVLESWSFIQILCVPSLNMQSLPCLSLNKSESVKRKAILKSVPAFQCFQEFAYWTKVTLLFLLISS